MSRGQLSDMAIASFTIRSLYRSESIVGETTSGKRSSGIGRLYDLEGPDGLRLTIRDTSWVSGERDIVACERHGSPERFDTLIERLRLTVLARGGAYVELRQARLRPNGRAGLFDAGLPALNEGARIDVKRTLLAHGAREVGTREQLLGDLERTRHRLGAQLTKRGEGRAPLVAYVLTRVAPVANGVTV